MCIQHRSAHAHSNTHVPVRSCELTRKKACGIVPHPLRLRGESRAGTKYICTEPTAHFAALPSLRLPPRFCAVYGWILVPFCYFGEKRSLFARERTGSSRARQEGSASDRDTNRRLRFPSIGEPGCRCRQPLRLVRDFYCSRRTRPERA